MKKVLPSRGFTLVELLVVVAIIAVLSAIALAIFGNTQKAARDARRKDDINAIAQAMEINYNSTTNNCNSETCAGQYCNLRACFFSNGQIPIDPINSGTSCSGNSCKYCVRTAVGACAAADTPVGNAQPPAGTSFIVCTSLETNSGTGGTNYACRTNQQ